MAKAQLSYACQSCGSSYRKWSGRCDACGEWNSIAEERTALSSVPKGLGHKRGNVIELVTLKSEARDVPRFASGIQEFDRVSGGGLVPGSAVLIGGDPGIGKSTLLLQVLGGLATQSGGCLYISGEEAADQVRMRARRLGYADADMHLATATNVRNILTTLDAGPPPRVVVIDSIQTLYVDSLDSAPGTVAQVRTSAHELVSYAKRKGVAMLIVGHVTKDGQIAGPRVLEHMVDTVLYFEGDRGHQFRILRAVKNRYGGVDEIGVFEMTGKGLMEVSNPSSLFLTDRQTPVAGSAVFAGLEGSRPVLVEIQALVAPTPAANPRRAVVGWDSGRLAMVLAVLDARCGLGLSGADVYLNVAGGLRIGDPAADLAAAAALVSSHLDRPLPEGTVLFGEISLAGEVRPVAQADARLKEAAKLGFTRALIPAGSKNIDSPMEIATFEKLQDLVDLLSGR